MTQIIIPNRNNGYPCISELPELESVKSLTAPFPEYLMRISGDKLNNGYPYISALLTLVKRVESDVYFATRKVTAMYYGDVQIETGYCNENEVFSVYYESV